MDIGFRLTLARKAKGLTISKLAEISGVSGTAITNYEGGYAHPRVDLLADLLADLSRTLGISLNWLVYGNHPPKADRELMTKLVLYEKKMEA